MPFAPDRPRVTYSETRTRTSSSYVKFSTDYRVVLRILDTNAKQSWKHWLQEANAGKGMMATCPNTSAQDETCPVDAEIRGLSKEDETYKERRAKKRYMVNVLDRTPYTTCDSCGTETPGKKCISCSADLKKHDFHPLNRVKILEGGPQLFTTTLNGVDDLQKEEFSLDITDYDITFATQGQGRDRKISAMPLAASELSEADFLDPETNEPQKLFDLDLLAEPTPRSEILLMMQGKTMKELNEARGLV